MMKSKSISLVSKKKCSLFSGGVRYVDIRGGSVVVKGQLGGRKRQLLAISVAIIFTTFRNKTKVIIQRHEVQLNINQSTVS